MNTSTRNCRCVPKHAKRTFVIGISAIVFATLLSFSLYFLYNAPTVGITLFWDKDRGHYEVLSSQPRSPLDKGDVLKRIGELEAGFHHLLTDNIYIYSRDELFSWLEAKRRAFQQLKQPVVVFSVERNCEDLDVSVIPRKASLSFRVCPTFYTKPKWGDKHAIWLALCLDLRSKI